MSAFSAAKYQANRANSQRSTGPATAEGKAKVSRNAVKTGLTGRTVLLPSDDAVQYEQHLHNYSTDFRPVGARETELVQSIADTAWRLRRIPELEMAIYAHGHSEQLSEQAAAGDDNPDTHLFELQTFLKYEKQLRNLHVQESRLRRHREKDLAELRALQQQRQAAQEEAQPGRSIVREQCQHQQPASRPSVGFVFSKRNQPFKEPRHQPEIESENDPRD